MHGFNQGRMVINDLIDSYHPDVFLLQEHWLTPANLCKFDIFKGYFSFGCSAMSECVSSGILRGRPFGGVITLIDNDLRAVTRTIHSSERYSIVKVNNYIIINIYLPCVGTDNRPLICQDIFNDIWSWREQYSDCECIIAGDFNVNLDLDDSIARQINSFCLGHDLIRCDIQCHQAPMATYVSDALNQESTIDYMFASSLNGRTTVDYGIIDPDINYSDHLPIFGIFTFSSLCPSDHFRVSLVDSPTQLRWDHADITSYYSYTYTHLVPILNDIDCLVNQLDYLCDPVISHIERICSNITGVLSNAANLFVPRRRKNFYKFWWNQELDLLKSESIDSNRLWKAAGKPRSGEIFNKRQLCKMRYRKQIRDSEALVLTSYTNELHEALLNKDCVSFWKSWNSKFDSVKKCVEVEGHVDPRIIADKLGIHFSQLYVANNKSRADELHAEYVQRRAQYSGFPLKIDTLFDADLVSHVIDDLHRGKASDLDGLSAEHLLNCHPVISCILAKLFRLLVQFSYVPTGFCRSYTVPIPKVKDCRTQSMLFDDFRGIAISSILSKVFEHCILIRFSHYLSSEDNQFGFKKGVGCSHAIYTVRNIVDKLVKGGSTVNLCSLDLSKAFDKTNHHALLIKLMDRYLPVNLLDILGYWLFNSWSCVKWFNYYSTMFQIRFGVRQGSVLSPSLFAVYLDDIVHGRRNGSTTSYIILYADDILIITSTLRDLQAIFTECEHYLSKVDMSINAKKSCCIRIGPRFAAFCCDIVTSTGAKIPWATTVKYLGIYLTSSRVFRCCLDEPKRSYYRSVNSILGKLCRIASEEVILHLVSSKCLPILLYGSETGFLSKTDIRSIDFAVTRFLMKLFNTTSMDIIATCIEMFNFHLPSALIEQRTRKFLLRYNSCENSLCRLFSGCT